MSDVNRNIQAPTGNTRAGPRCSEGVDGTVLR
jgi:hypothetical protein